MSQSTMFIEEFGWVVMFLSTIISIIVGVVLGQEDEHWLLLPAFFLVFDLGLVIGHFASV